MFVFLIPKIFLSFCYFTSHLLSFKLHIVEVKMNGAPLLLSQTLTNKITPIDLITDDTLRVQAKGGFREMDQATLACVQLM